MTDTPDAAMMAPIEKIVRFIASGDEESLSAFADRDVAILENFSPHMFNGPDAVARWADAMRSHIGVLSDLVHNFGPAQDFSDDGGLVFFSLPTHWRGKTRGRSFEEDGGWTFVLVRQGAEWRVRNYAWAVTRMVYT